MDIKECKHEWMDYPMHPSKYCRKCGVNRESEPKYKKRIEELKYKDTPIWEALKLHSDKINEITQRINERGTK